MRQHVSQLLAESTTYTQHNKHKGRVSMESEGFEPAIPEMEWPQTHAKELRGHLNRKFHNYQILHAEVNKFKDVLL
jgi:hypothetical protein